MANNNYLPSVNSLIPSKSKTLALAAALPVVAEPIEKVKLLDYALAHTTVNAGYGLEANATNEDGDMYLGLMDKDPFTSDEQRARDEFGQDDEHWNEVVFEELGGTSVAKLALHDQWIRQKGYKLGAVVNMDLPEQGISGPFRITSIRHFLPQKKPDEDSADDYECRPTNNYLSTPFIPRQRWKSASYILF